MYGALKANIDFEGQVLEVQHKKHRGQDGWAGPRKGESNKRASTRRRGMVVEEPSIINILFPRYFLHFPIFSIIPNFPNKMQHDFKIHLHLRSKTKGSFSIVWNISKMQQEGKSTENWNLNFWQVGTKEGVTSLLLQHSYANEDNLE